MFFVLFSFLKTHVLVPVFSMEWSHCSADWGHQVGQGYFDLDIWLALVPSHVFGGLRPSTHVLSYQQPVGNYTRAVETLVIIILAVLRLLSRVQLSATPWTAARQASLSFTLSQSLLKLTSIQPSHPLLSPSPPALNLSQHQGLFQWVSSSHQVATVLEL